MAITYSPSDDKITVTGYSEATPCTFEDIYQADKAGTLTLIDRDGMNSTDTDPVNNTYNLRPADEKLLGGTKHDLYIIVENWDATSTTVKLIGTNENDDSLTEDINITGNGTYYASNLFKTLTQTQITAFTGTSFDYSLIQGQWGVVSKQGDNQFLFSAKLQIGDGTTGTHFTDTEKNIHFGTDVSVGTGQYAIAVKNNAHFTLGYLISESAKTSGKGCNIYSEAGYTNTNKGILKPESGSTVYLYSSTFSGRSKDYGGGVYWIGAHRTWNCFMGSQTYQYGINEIGNFYNVVFVDAETGFYSWDSATVVDKVSFNKVSVLTYFTGGSTYSDVYARNYDMIVLWSGASDAYMVDFDVDQWTVKSYYMTGNAYRQYSFDLKVIDKDENPIKNASVKIWDKDNNLITDTATDESGEILTQTLNWGYYEKTEPVGSVATSVMQTPHILLITKPGYQTYKKKFTLDKKIDWTIGLKKISINIDNEVVT